MDVLSKEILDELVANAEIAICKENQAALPN